MTFNALVETVDSSNVSAIASNTQILTCVPDQLTTENISAAANIAAQILKKPNISEDSQASVAVMATVSQLLDANETEFNHNNLVNVTTSLTKTMEEFSFTANISQPNIAIQSAPLKLSSSTILFSAQRDTALGYYQSTKLEIKENVSGLIGDLSTEVQILFNIINTSSSDNGRVGFVLYQNDKLFQSRIYRSHNSFSKQIVSGNIDNRNFSSIEIAFSPKAFQIKYKYAKPLEYISYIGVGLSMAGLVITILFQILTSCWLAALDQNQNFSMQKPMLWSFLLPVALILLFNIIVFIKITVSVIWKKNENLTRNKKDSSMKKMIGTISIVVVLGITWTIGYLMLINHEETSLVFSYVFCIFNATQNPNFKNGTK
ncbi:hypothetical protein llap_11301 [Limosa lapponica baueri]|uniref:G-protein coupled receptors family 2 profile 2 domain-containing protein n=1 Tax=Limosa lapponica baueri TaxID=1758121 RepID=A0A2I0TX51_LIMLA|nr:hypothetical protein llap_11301 [Limosa lapponica baueri]